MVLKLNGVLGVYTGMDKENTESDNQTNNPFRLSRIVALSTITVAVLSVSFWLIAIAYGRPEVTNTIEAESGSLALPMISVQDTNASGGSYILSDKDNSGTATYTFQINSQGTYKIVARVYAENDKTDSFWVNIDNRGEILWDLNPTETASDYNVWRDDEVTNRGTGSFDNPQDDPYTFDLDQGTHTITFKVRQSKAKLDKFSFVKI